MQMDRFNRILLIIMVMLAGCTGAGEAPAADRNESRPTGTLDASLGGESAGNTTPSTPTPPSPGTPPSTSPATPPGTSPTTAPPSPSPKQQPAEPPAIFFEGSGKRVTAEFTTTSKPVKLRMTHSGSHNFAIWVMDAVTGQKEELAVNEIGAYEGTHYFVIAPGTYVLDVTADGAWNVTVTQPKPTSGMRIPTDLSGIGDNASEPLQLGAGLRRFAMAHDGSSNFAVWLIDSKGNRVDLLANEIGSWDGEKAVGISRAGVHYLDITADGTWSIKVT